MTKAENIRNQCMKILDKYDADYRGVTVDRIDGTTYVIFKYYGGTNDTVDRNDDSWDEMFELDGVVDVGYGEGYGIEGKYEDSLLIELDEDIVESKKSARKSMKESKDITIEEFISDYKNNDCFSIRDKENGSECFWGNKKDVLDSDYRLFTVFDSEIDRHNDDLILYIDLEKNAWVESKKSARKSIKESADDNWYKLKMLNEMLDAMEEDEYNIPKLAIYDVTPHISLDEGAIKALIKYYK